MGGGVWTTGLLMMALGCESDKTEQENANSNGNQAVASGGESQKQHPQKVKKLPPPNASPYQLQ